MISFLEDAQCLRFEYAESAPDDIQRRCLAFRFENIQERTDSADKTSQWLPQETTTTLT